MSEREKKQMSPSGVIQATILTQLATRQVPKMQRCVFIFIFFTFCPFLRTKKWCHTFIWHNSCHNFVCSSQNPSRKWSGTNSCKWLWIYPCRCPGGHQTWGLQCRFLLGFYINYYASIWDRTQLRREKCLIPLAKHTSRGPQLEISSPFGNKQFSLTGSAITTRWTQHIHTKH